MTWYDWVHSDYNDGSFRVNCDGAYGLMYRGSVTNIYDTASEVIITSRNYSNYAGIPERCIDVSG